MSHTIVLLQANSNASSRQYSDFENEDKAMDAICQLYEAKLKTENRNAKKITYDITDLFAFIDQLPDLATLTFDARISAYVPRNKQWIKDRVFAHLKKQAGA